MPSTIAGTRRPCGLPSPTHENVRDRHGRLRLGFVSPDLGRHPVGYFLVRVLENLSQEQHETICYSDRIVKDDLDASSSSRRDPMARCDRHERRAAGGADPRRTGSTSFSTWQATRPTTGCWSSPASRRRSRSPGSAMKGRPAWRRWTTCLPIATWSRKGAERYYREQVLRMPDGYLCYDPPAAAPPVGPLPSLDEGICDLRQFQQSGQDHAGSGGGLGEDPAPVARQPRLVLKYRGLGDPSVQRRYLDLFAAHGVEPQRLELLPSSSYAEYLAAYDQVDLALDPFPFPAAPRPARRCGWACRWSPVPARPLPAGIRSATCPTWA